MVNYQRNYKLINRQFKQQLLPTIAVGLAGNFAVLVDAFLVSSILGSQNLATIQSVEPLVLLVCVIYWMIGLGGGILCSLEKAAFNDDKANAIFTVAIVSVVLLGMAISIAVLSSSNVFSQIICNSDSLRPFVNQYLAAYIIGVPFLYYMSCLAYFIKSYGFIQLQFRALLMANVINVFCDIIFMHFLNMGIGGAGLATSVGYIIASVYISSYFLSSKKPVRFIRVKASSFISYFSKICKGGFATASSNLYEAIKLAVINPLLVITVGAVGLEAFNMANNILFIVLILIFGVIQSVVPIISVYFKEENFRAVEYVCKRSMKIILALGIFFSALFIIFPEIALILFNVNNPESIPVVTDAVRLFTISITGYAITNLYIFYTQSVQYVKLSNFVAVTEGLIFPVLFAYLFSYIWGINGIWISFTATEVVTLIIIFFYTRHVTKKTDNDRSGFFLIKNYKDINMFEYSINGNMDEALDLSKKIEDDLSYTDSSDTIGQVIRELLANIIKLNKDEDLIDVTIKDKKDSIVISAKYPGIPFNPLQGENDENSNELNKYIDNMEYSKILGLNNTEISINK